MLSENARGKIPFDKATKSFETNSNAGKDHNNIPEGNTSTEVLASPNIKSLVVSLE